jgi:hypothetical protein
MTQPESSIYTETPYRLQKNSGTIWCIDWDLQGCDTGTPVAQVGSHFTTGTKLQDCTMTDHRTSQSEQSLP